MKKSLLLIPALALGAVAASGQFIYTQPFDNTTNRTDLSTLENWGWASADGVASNDNNRQYGMMSEQNGQGGTPGFAFTFQEVAAARGQAAWFAGDLETPTDAMSLAQSDLTSLSLRIGHGNTAFQTRWLMRIDDNGTDRWFVSLQTYQMATAVGGGGDFAAENIGISANFSDLTWRPFLSGTSDFDGKTGSASSGFTIITNAANPTASTLPSGNITALGVYHWHSGNGATRFDDFTIIAVPEPSTYAAIIGLLALGFVAYRRRRR